MSDYYERQVSAHVDGTPIFKTEEDESSERDVAAMLEKAMNVKCHSFGALSALDWYFLRDERPVGWGELKTRTHKSTTFPTVFLNMRKWLALMLASAGTGQPSIFVVRFADCTRYIPVNEIDASRMKIGGCKKRVKSRNDVEPVIEVPIESMHVVRA